VFLAGGSSLFVRSASHTICKYVSPAFSALSAPVDRQI
jgi:hypothetical protein